MRKKIKSIDTPFLIALVLVACGCIILQKLNLGICPIRYFTGIPCPTCGMTRALLALVQFDFAKSLSYHLMLLPLLAILLANAARRAVSSKAAHIIDIFTISVAVAIFIYYIIRLALGIQI